MSPQRHLPMVLQKLIELQQLGLAEPEKKFLTAGLDILSALIESEIAYLHFVNDDQETLELVTWSTNTKNYCQAAYDQHYPISQAGIWADSFRLRKPVVHNDYANETHKKGVPEGHFPLIRHAGVPVIANNKVVALIGVGNKVSTYTDEDTALVQMFANELWQLTSLRRTQQKLTHQYQQLDELVNASGEGIIGIDQEGKITFVNHAALNLLGYTHADELIGLPAHQTFHHHKPNGDPYPESECPNYLTRECKILCVNGVNHNDTRSPYMMIN